MKAYLAIKFHEDYKNRKLIEKISESKGVGLGIEAGYAYSRKKPVIVIAKKGSETSTTMKGVAKKVISYAKPEELVQKLRAINL